MRNLLKSGKFLVVIVAMLLGLTVTIVSANGSVSISGFYVENDIAKVQLDNGIGVTSMKYHLYVNGDFYQWGVIPVVSGLQNVDITIVNPPSTIENSEIALFKDQAEDEQLASKYWDGALPTPTVTPTSSPTAIPTETSPATPVPTGTPEAPVASEITIQVITQTVQVSLSASAPWHLYLDGVFARNGEGMSLVVGLDEFATNMEVVTNPGSNVQRNLFKTKEELLSPEPTATPVPTGTPEAPVASEITIQVITQTVQVSLSASAPWHLYLDGVFARNGEGMSLVVGLDEFATNMEVVTNPDTELRRNLFVRRDELFKVYLPAVSS